MAENQAGQTQDQPKKIVFSEILDMLNRGIDRKAIAKHYGVTQATMKDIFTNPKLKGKKVKPRSIYEVVDDLPEVEAKEKKAKAEKAEVSETPVASIPTPEVAPAAPTGNTGDANKAVW